MAAVAADITAPHVVHEIPGAIRLLSDGTVERLDRVSALAGGVLRPFPEEDTVEWKDVVYDSDHDLKLRVYRPRHRPADGGKLPVLVYYHGGGFCLGSFAMPLMHLSCLRLAGELPAVVLSADYRLAPEHRLPAGIEDAKKVIFWLQEQATKLDDPWLDESADFTRVFVSGESAGGNFAHHVAVRFAGADLSPLTLRAFILIVPGFTGVEKTKSELEALDDGVLNKVAHEGFMKLALPAGGTLDHPAMNPFGPESPDMAPLDLAPMLVVTAEHDMLRDRDLDYFERLRAMGKKVELAEFPGEDHGFFTIKVRSPAADELVRVVREFIVKNGDGSS